jgi:hypothetical protein
MKQFYTWAMSAAMVLASANALQAQSRKTWDFTKGWSEETKANLNADANWLVNDARTDKETGEIRGWQDGTKMSGTLMANGEAISELEGLVFGTAGLNNSGNYLLDPGSIRMARANMVVNLPKLANGQTVTIEAKSANSSTARGITANTTNLTKESGPEGDIAPGSDGHQTWVWRVTTDETDSVDVSFKILVGGVDIYLIQIDNGENGDIDATPLVAYLYDGTIEGYDVEDDDVINQTSISSLDYVPMDLANYDGERTLADSLEQFDVVIYSEHLQASTPNVDLLYKEINRVPVLNFNPALYAAWGQGDVVKPSPASSTYTLTEEGAEHALFEGCETEGDELVFYLDEGAVEGDKALAYTLNEGSEFVDDVVLATVGENSAIHVHGSKNTYLLIPFSSENFVVEDELIVDAQIFDNAISYLKATKSKVNKASKPSISFDYKDHETTVTLKTSIAGAKIYYTTDGSDVTTESAIYSEPLVFTEPATVQAFITARGYNNSDVLSQEVIVKTQLAAPSYKVAYEGKTASVELSAAEGDIYYNITGKTDPSTSSIYVDSLGITVTRPTILTAFAYAEDKLPSEKVEFVVDFPEMAYYNDTLVHLDFQGSEWNGGSDLVERANYYSEEVEDFTVSENEDGTQDTTYIYKPVGELYEVNIDDAWKVNSYGQRILVQKTGSSTTVGASYGPATAFDAGATGCAISFLQTGKGGDPATAALISKTTYAAPFSVALHFTGQAESGDGKVDGKYREAVEISVSTDGEQWNVVDTVATNYMKLMSYQTVEVAGEGNYYVKVASATPAKNSASQKTMIFDLYLLAPVAERPTLGLSEIFSNTEKEIKAVRMYNLSGQQIRVAQPGINLIRTTYSDGSVQTKKVLVK